MKPAFAVVLTLLATVAGGCETIKRIRGEPGWSKHVWGYRVRLPQSGVARAGVGKADMTPPAGFPTGGHGPGGNLARGHWMRLYARAFFFEDLAGHTLIMVSCDTFAIPGGLQAKVARNLAQEWTPKGILIPPEALILTATHTHQGPGNYMTSRVYNSFGSSQPNFSEDLFNFLVERIQEAVDRAIEDARASTEPASMTLHRARVGKDLVRNRSPRVFMLNRNREQLMEDFNLSIDDCTAEHNRGEPVDGWDIKGCPRLRAADRTVAVLEVRRGSDVRAAPIGVLVFFAAHPTVLDHHAAVFSGDFTGYAMSLLEAEWGRHRRYPVAAFFNGAEGDITARRTRRDTTDVENLGTSLAASVDEALRTQPILKISSDDDIRVRRRMVHPGVGGDAVCRQTVQDTVCRPTVDGDPTTLAEVPMFGAAALGGGEDDRTILYDLGWREGVRGIPKKGQGPKQPALDPTLVPGIEITDIFAPPWAFPTALPIVVASLGKLTIAALPLEVSTATGHAIGQAVKPTLEKQAGSAPYYFQVVGLANEYVSYLASEAEYMAQDYMGASTIWGPHEACFVACSVTNLLTSTEPDSKYVSSETYQPGPRTCDFGPKFCGDARDRPDEELEDILIDADGNPQRHLPWFSWEERELKIDGELAATQKRNVTLWHRERSGWVLLEDDCGSGLLTLLVHPENKTTKQRLWAAVWIHAPNWSTTDEFAFAVRTAKANSDASDRLVCSNKFTLGSPVIDDHILANNDCSFIDTAQISACISLDASQASH